MIENETLIAENVEVDIETLINAQSHPSMHAISKAKDKVVEAFIDALYPEDREKLEAYKNQ